MCLLYGAVLSTGWGTVCTVATGVPPCAVHTVGVGRHVVAVLPLCARGPHPCASAMPLLCADICSRDSAAHECSCGHAAGMAYTHDHTQQDNDRTRRGEQVYWMRHFVTETDGCAVPCRAVMCQQHEQETVSAGCVGKIPEERTGVCACVLSSSAHMPCPCACVCACRQARYKAR